MSNIYGLCGESVRQKSCTEVFRSTVPGLQQVCFPWSILYLADGIILWIHQRLKAITKMAEDLLRYGALPLTQLMRKGEKFVWTDERQESFEELKRRLVSAPILTLPSGSGGFQIYSNASKKDLERLDVELKFSPVKRLLPREPESILGSARESHENKVYSFCEDSLKITQELSTWETEGVLLLVSNLGAVVAFLPPGYEVLYYGLRESRNIKRYVYGPCSLDPGITLTVNGAKDYVRMLYTDSAGALNDEAVRNGSIKKVEKRGNVAEPSKDKNGRYESQT
ncbi:putative reverse transcriptase domain-containing protein [Tanacetum coccineum]